MIVTLIQHLWLLFIIILKLICGQFPLHISGRVHLELHIIFSSGLIILLGTLLALLILINFVLTVELRCVGLRRLFLGGLLLFLFFVLLFLLELLGHVEEQVDLACGVGLVLLTLLLLFVLGLLLLLLLLLLVLVLLLVGEVDLLLIMHFLIDLGLVFFILAVLLLLLVLPLLDIVSGLVIGHLLVNRLVFSLVVALSILLLIAHALTLFPIVRQPSIFFLRATLL